MPASHEKRLDCKVIKPHFYTSQVKCVFRLEEKASGVVGQNSVTLLDIGKVGISPSFESLRFPKLQTFVEMFCGNLESPVLVKLFAPPIWLPENSANI